VTAVPRPPSRARLAFYRTMNPVIRFMVRRGTGGRGADLLRILRVRGRKSGRDYEVPVRVAVLDGQRYVISLLGDAQWVRNLRAAGQAQLLHGTSAEAVSAREISEKEKTELLTRLCGIPQFASRARSVLKSAFGHRTRELGEPQIRLLGQVWHIFQLGDLGRRPSVIGVTCPAD
jgi:deazaflavin-dependent oxidoreductase (nitroreductase family)